MTACKYFSATCFDVRSKAISNSAQNYIEFIIGKKFPARGFLHLSALKTIKSTFRLGSAVIQSCTASEILQSNFKYTLRHVPLDNDITGSVSFICISLVLQLVQRRVDSIQLQYSRAKLFVNSEKNRFAECLAGKLCTYQVSNIIITFAQLIRKYS